MLFDCEPRVLAIGAHPDDIELGAGGLIRRLVRDRSAHVDFLILSAGLRSWQLEHELPRSSRVAEASEGADQLGVPMEHVTVLAFEDCKLHEHVHDMIGEIERRLYTQKGTARYNIILTHSPADTHSDHRHVYESTISASRYFNGTILMYQAPSTVPNEFKPIFFVTLDDDAIAKKDAAIAAHVSQRDKEFMRFVRTTGMAKAWAVFHRRSEDMLEAFEVFKTYWE